MYDKNTRYRSHFCFFYFLFFLHFIFMKINSGAVFLEWEQINVKEAFDTAIWHALVSANESQKVSFWKRLFCLTWKYGSNGPIEIASVGVVCGLYETTGYTFFVFQETLKDFKFKLLTLLLKIIKYNTLAVAMTMTMVTAEEIGDKGNFIFH